MGSVATLAFAETGSEGFVMNGRYNVELLAMSRSYLDSFWESANRENQQALWISSASFGDSFAVASPGLSTTWRNPRRANRDGFGVGERTGEVMEEVDRDGCGCA